MTSDLIALRPFVPLEATEDEWRMFHAFRRVRHAETRPDDPIDPDDVVEIAMKQPDVEGESRRFYVEQDGRIVCSLNAWAMMPKAPAYESNKHLIDGFVSVLADHRRRGLATVGFRKILEIMKEWDRTVLTIWTEQDEGHAFLKWLGAEEKWTGAENRLDFSQIDWELVEGWVAEGRKRSAESEGVLYEHRLPEDVWDSYLPIMSEVLNTMPFEEMDHGEIKLTPDVLREWYKQADELGNSHHTFMTREPDGQISGMTDVFWSPHRPTFVSQAFTGVHPDFRGRGIGRWVKAEMLVWLRDRYEGLEWVVTDNAGSNKWMLDINEQLGFRQYRPTSTYQISRDALDEKLTSLP